MLTINPQSGPVKKPAVAAKVQACPECGSIMSEVDRITENTVSFIWYECTRSDCDGQWLQKEPVKMGVA